MRQRNKILKLSLLLVTAILTLSSCMEDKIGDNFYTFTGQTVGQYIESGDSAINYTEFKALLDTTGMLSLLKAYGTYTCFLPDNDAMYDFYETNGKTSLEDFELGDMREIAQNSIVNNVELTSDLFTVGASGYYTMSGRELSFYFDSDSTGIIYRVFTDSKITERDIDLHNGYVHRVNHVITPSDSIIPTLLAVRPKYSLFYEALELTEISDTLALIKDHSYVAPLKINGKEDGDPDHTSAIYRIPERRLYGYTALVESNETFAAAGITNIEEMKAYAKAIYDRVYPEDDDIDDVTNPRNSLNRFIAYHILDKKIAKRFFVDKYDNTGNNNALDGSSHSIRTYDLYEYLETLAPNTLIEVKIDRSMGESNLINMNPDTEEAIRFTDDVDNAAVNGYYHEIDKVLTFNQEFLGQLSSKRIRIDALSFFPELTNNNIRGEVLPVGEYHSWLIPEGYLDRATVKEGHLETFTHDYASTYRGDEIFTKGEFSDFTFKVSPVPSGTYEVRFAYTTNGARGIYQIYLDGTPCGLPLNLNTSLADPSIDYETPGSDLNDMQGYQNDKMMRNRGYMKAPASYHAIADGFGHNTISARYDPKTARRILGVFTFNEMQSHVFRFKAVGNESNASEPQFMFDYLEFVPTEMLESEGID